MTHFELNSGKSQKNPLYALTSHTYAISRMLKDKNACKTLQEQKTILAQEVAGRKKESERLEANINVDKFLLQGVLAQVLVNLKQQRPDLFTLTGQDQIVSLARLFLGFITQ